MDATFTNGQSAAQYRPTAPPPDPYEDGPGLGTLGIDTGSHFGPAPAPVPVPVPAPANSLPPPYNVCAGHPSYDGAGAGGCFYLEAPASDRIAQPALTGYNFYFQENMPYNPVGIIPGYTPAPGSELGLESRRVLVIEEKSRSCCSETICVLKNCICCGCRFLWFVIFLTICGIIVWRVVLRAV